MAWQQERIRLWTSIGGKLFNAVQRSESAYKVGHSPSLPKISAFDTGKDCVIMASSWFMCPSTRLDSLVPINSLSGWKERPQTEAQFLKQSESTVSVNGRGAGRVRGESIMGLRH